MHAGKWGEGKIRKNTTQRGRTANLLLWRIQHKGEEGAGPERKKVRLSPPSDALFAKRKSETGTLHWRSALKRKKGSWWGKKKAINNNGKEKISQGKRARSLTKEGHVTDPKAPGTGKYSIIPQGEEEPGGEDFK